MPRQGTLVGQPAGDRFAPSYFDLVVDNLLFQILCAYSPRLLNQSFLDRTAIRFTIDRDELIREPVSAVITVCIWP